MAKGPNVLITAGGTREPIDDVRYVGNFSAGSFGVAIANAFANRIDAQCTWAPSPGDSSVTLLAPKETVERFTTHPFVKHEKYTDIKSLGRLLLENETRPDIVVHAAAVADFSPVPSKGKISSDQDELTVTMKRNPKLLAGLRRAYGPQPYLVGFKLLSDVSKDELVEVGTNQLLDNNLDLTAANDLQDIRPLGRRVIAITPNGETQDIEGSTKSVAERLVAFILERAQAKEATRVASIPKEPI